MLDIILDTLIDGLKLLPFLWLAFFFIELLEHKFQRQGTLVIEKAGRFGPLLGSVLGCFPQCGFSVMATNLYVTRIITLGTLVSIYLSTSDEMLPILLAHGSDGTVILQILGVKFLIGVFSGFLIDLLFRKKFHMEINHLCEEEHCHCEEGVLRSSFTHTSHTFLFIIAVSFGINLLMAYGGEDFLSHVFLGNHWLSPFVASLIGLIPNCAASVVITELYLEGIIPFSSAIAGLLTGSGVAILVLFRSNKHVKENMMILFLIYFIGVVSGILLEVLSYLL